MNKKRTISRAFQANLLHALEHKYNQQRDADDPTMVAHSVLTQMRYLMQTYIFDDDVLDAMSSFVDHIMYALNMHCRSAYTSKHGFTFFHIQGI